MLLYMLGCDELTASATRLSTCPSCWGWPCAMPAHPQHESRGGAHQAEQAGTRMHQSQHSALQARSQLCSAAVQAASRPVPAQPSSPSCSAHAQPPPQLHAAKPAAERYPPSPPSDATAHGQACSPTEVPSSSPDASQPLHQADAGQGPAPEQQQAVPGGAPDEAARSSTPSSVGSKQKSQGQLQPQAGQSLLSRSPRPDKSPSTGASAGRGTSQAREGGAAAVAAGQSAGLLRTQPGQAPAPLPSPHPPPFTIFGRCSQALAPGQPLSRDSLADAGVAQHLHKMVHRHPHQQQQVKTAELARPLGCRTAAATEAGALHHRAQLHQPMASLSGEGEPRSMVQS